jgi:hypothetical protein
VVAIDVMVPVEIHAVSVNEVEVSGSDEALAKEPVHGTLALAAQDNAGLLPELAGIAEASIFLPLRVFEMHPTPIGVWPICAREIDVDIGLGLLVTVERRFDACHLEIVWPGASASLDLLLLAGFAPDAVRLARLTGSDLTEPLTVLLAAKAHPRMPDIAMWFRLDTATLPVRAKSAHSFR